ncbi:MAG: ATP-binding cassette domain-containing protein, partial [Tissierellia bacterium]|nr:ATP-binding cassette domain-containing protein [Tissierellia bacterium]
MNKQIKVKDLSVSYQKSGKYHKIIDNIDFYIEPSEIFAIIGESGSGKTTITKALTGLLPKSTKISGLMQIGESNYDLSNDYERKKLSGTEIGLVFQDARSSLNPMRKIIKHFEEIYVNIKGLSKEECYTKSAEILKYLGF